MEPKGNDMADELAIAAIGAFVRQKRGDVGLRSAAAEIGISPTTLCRIENGHVPDVQTLEKACKWLGYSVLLARLSHPSTAEAVAGDAPFVVGDRVEKLSGYRFPGVVTAIDTENEDRYVVTANHPDFAGMKHIFSGAQLRVRQDDRGRLGWPDEQTSAVAQPCAKCGSPLGPTSHWVGNNRYHPECDPHIAHPIGETGGPAPAVREAEVPERASEKFKLWFFRDIVSEQRLALFSLFGMPVDEISNHGVEAIALRHVLSALEAAQRARK